jgi:hypothetical protein
MVFGLESAGWGDVYVVWLRQGHGHGDVATGAGFGGAARYFMKEGPCRGAGRGR